MNDLKVIENELVPVYETSTGEKVVYGTELHEVLEVKSKFADWVKNRLNDCEAVENENFESFSKILEKGGRPQTEYIIKLDTAKEMAMLERNEKGKEVRRYFIDIEKKYKQSANNNNLSPELQMFQSIFNAVVKNEQLVNKSLEQSNKALDEIQGIREVVSLNIKNWRTDTTNLINKIAFKLGGFENIKAIREESYKNLEQRINVSLNIRVTNIKKNLALNGVCKSKIDKVNQLDAINNDKKLIETYVAIVKEMAIKYGVA